MKKTIALAALAVALIPVGAFAAPKHPAPTAYVCQKCHMHYTAAQAKKDHYKDPMDGGVLVPMKATAGKKTAAMKGMKM